MTENPFTGQDLSLPQGARRQLGRGLCYLVGESPRRGTAVEPALAAGPSVATLARLTGLTYLGYLRFFDRANVLARVPEEGAPWPVVEARKRGEELAAWLEWESLSMNEPGFDQHVVVLGRRAWMALGWGEQPFWCSVSQADAPRPTRYWLLPHPSRRSRLWNVPECEERTRRTLRDLVAHRQAQGLPVERAEQET